MALIHGAAVDISVALSVQDGEYRKNWGPTWDDCMVNAGIEGQVQIDEIKTQPFLPGLRKILHIGFNFV